MAEHVKWLGDWVQRQQYVHALDGSPFSCNVGEDPEGDYAQWLSINQYVEVVEPSAGQSHFKPYIDWPRPYIGGPTEGNRTV